MAGETIFVTEFIVAFSNYSTAHFWMTYPDAVCKS